MNYSLLQSFRSFFSVADPYHEPDPEIAKQVFDLYEIAVVCYRISPRNVGQVEYQGRHWSAVCLEDLVLLPGTQVKVIDRVELNLVVRPLMISQARSLPKKRLNRSA
ncbi:NfeD family protein [Leptolyngbya sp. AN03gr2]|uniref:NfeD family protein n=1 Tax=unclassified Leptolyngbya TaxID=2650499 RepID=UPI003D318679